MSSQLERTFGSPRKMNVASIKPACPQATDKLCNMYQHDCVRLRNTWSLRLWVHVRWCWCDVMLKAMCTRTTTTRIQFRLKKLTVQTTFCHSLSRENVTNANPELGSGLAWSLIDTARMCWADAIRSSLTLEISISWYGMQNKELTMCRTYAWSCNQ